VLGDDGAFVGATGWQKLKPHGRISSYAIVPAKSFGLLGAIGRSRDPSIAAVQQIRYCLGSFRPALVAPEHPVSRETEDAGQHASGSTAAVVKCAAVAVPSQSDGSHKPPGTNALRRSPGEQPCPLRPPSQSTRCRERVEQVMSRLTPDRPWFLSTMTSSCTRSPT
jgi:hypothetical protein